MYILRDRQGFFISLNKVVIIYFGTSNASVDKRVSAGQQNILWTYIAEAIY